MRIKVFLFSFLSLKTKRSLFRLSSCKQNPFAHQLERFCVFHFLISLLFSKIIKHSRLEVTYANNNSLIKKFENMPTIEPIESGKKSKKSSKKPFADKPKQLLMSGGGKVAKDVVCTDGYY